jgi:hypothetical protein
MWLARAWLHLTEDSKLPKTVHAHPRQPLACQEGDFPRTHAQVLDFAQVDSWRAQRTGFPEVVHGAGKSAAQVAAIMRQLAQNEQLVLATRISPEVGPLPLSLLPAHGMPAS